MLNIPYIRTHILMNNILTFISLSVTATITAVKTYMTIKYISEGFDLLYAGLLTTPLLFLFLLFPVYFVVSNVFLIFTPKHYWYENSAYYIHKIPDIYTVKPSVTIQVPVYDENFKSVIIPTLTECMRARDYYVYCGGTCNILVNDDGIFKILKDRLYLLENNEKVNERVNYYKNNNISFTARKYANRTGKFKKASNMNYAQVLGLKRQIPTPIASLQRMLSPKITTNNTIPEHSNVTTTTVTNIGNSPGGNLKLKISEEKPDIVIDDTIIIQQDSNGEEKQAILRDKTPLYKPKNFKNVIIDRSHRHMYFGDINLGDYIMLVDSDTTVPEKIIPKAVSIFESDPRVGYTQHYTLPLESSYQNYFSRSISAFTENLYHVIFRACTRNGDISPLIGHNIILRKSAMERIAEFTSEKLYWREDRVSEDFDLCLRMYQGNFIGKYVCDDSQFGEGVSLSYRDEIVKHAKFAYGASEIIFNPFLTWCKGGVLTAGFKSFMTCKNVQFSSKIGILGYLMTYFSISSSVIITPIIAICSCFIPHWELLLFDPLFAYLYLFVIYGVLNPLVVYKLKRQLPVIPKFPPSILREYSSGIIFCLFYSSISLSMFVGIISHIFNLNISWGSTRKTISNESRLYTLCNTIKTEKYQLIYSVMMISGTFILYIKYGMPATLLFPMLSISVGHLIAPFLLNPSIFFLY